MKWKLIEEAKTPSDMKSIEASFNKDVSDEKFTPTVEFVKNVYDKMNKELFGNGLVKSDEIDISIVPLYSENGITQAHDLDDGSVEINGLEISSTTTLTMHTWMETILHEMIHIDELMHHPEHFKDGVKQGGHGEWFKERANEFKKKGFNVVTEYNGDFGTNTEDEIYLKNKNGVFIKVANNPIGFLELIKVPDDERGYALTRLRDSGYNKVWMMKSDNENAGRLEFSKYDDEYGYFKYHADEKFIKAFGPFEEVKEIDLNHIVAESSDKHLLPGDIVEIDTPGFKRFVRNGVRHYIFID